MPSWRANCRWCWAKATTAPAASTCWSTTPACCIRASASDTCPLLLTQALAPWLADGARVVNLSSRLGSIALTTRFGTPSYNLGKAALNMATVLLAQALAERGIVVVALSPGWVRTDMGGSDAELDPAQAVAGLLRVAEGLQPGDSGRFLDWQGESIPW